MRPLMQAVEFECLELMEVLLSHGAETEPSDVETSPLQQATCNGCLSACVVLIQWGADINVRSEGSLQTLPLYFALDSCNMAIAKMLLECWCDVPMFFLLTSQCDLIEDDDDEDGSIRTLMTRNARNTKPLSSLCRTCILTRMRTCQRTRNDVKSLPLPTKLERFLRFEELETLKLADAF